MAFLPGGSRLNSTTMGSAIDVRVSGLTSGTLFCAALEEVSDRGGEVCAWQALSRRKAKHAPAPSIRRPSRSIVRPRVSFD
ncbi:hypothetical protein D3C75_963640 [compost metagenome]